jgi:uncharacterized protein
MVDGLTLGAALLPDLAASGHCLVMCSGIRATHGIATVKGMDGRLRAALLVYPFGRITSYTLAGRLFGGMLGGFTGLLDIDAVCTSTCALSAFALLLGALVACGPLRDSDFGVGRRVWPKLAPLGRKLPPVISRARAFGFGRVWTDADFVYAVLLTATLQLDALRAAMTRAASGLGAAPARRATTFGAQRVCGMVLLASAALTWPGHG